MSRKVTDLSKAGRQELALAILLWKDFKSEGKSDILIMKNAIEFANMLGVKNEFDELLKTLPPIKIELRYK